MSEPEVPTHRRQPPVDRRGRQTALLHAGAVQLDVRRASPPTRRGRGRWPTGRSSAGRDRYASSVRPLYLARNAAAANCSSHGDRTSPSVQTSARDVIKIAIGDLLQLWRSHSTHPDHNVPARNVPAGQQPAETHPAVGGRGSTPNRGHEPYRSTLTATACDRTRDAVERQLIRSDLPIERNRDHGRYHLDR